MNFKLKTSLIIGAIVASSLVYAATVISPNQNNNSGSIPSGGEFKHEVRQFEKSYDNQQAEQISLM
ncbi:hypothetical protein KTH94_12610, partial [Acinetobacter pittii]|nr:hypothetical protein [Acinetobacter pittii]MCU4461037.1 hypothetical protein [Acinetobacter pittii]